MSWGPTVGPKLKWLRRWGAVLLEPGLSQDFAARGSICLHATVMRSALGIPSPKPARLEHLRRALNEGTTLVETCDADVDKVLCSDMCLSRPCQVARFVVASSVQSFMNLTAAGSSLVAVKGGQRWSKVVDGEQKVDKGGRRWSKWSFEDLKKRKM